MRFSLLFILHTLLGIATYASNNQNILYDTTRFEEGINEYSFLWSKKNQFFYWDTISHNVDCHNVKFKILNDTKDTINIARIGGGDGALLYFRCDPKYGPDGRRDHSFLPDETLCIKIKLYSIEYRRNFTKNLLIRYEVNGSTHYFSIGSKGHFIKEYQGKLSVDKANKKGPRKQRFDAAIDEYIFNFSADKQSFIWDSIKVTPELDEIRFLIQNTTGKEITVFNTKYQDNLIAWTASKEVTVAPNAYYEVYPKFYSFNYYNQKFNDDLIINYSEGNQEKKLIIETKALGIFGPQSVEGQSELRQHYKNRGIKVNGSSQTKQEGIDNYNYNFAHINYAFDWGDFSPDQHNNIFFHLKNTSQDTLFILQLNNPIINFTTTGTTKKHTITNKNYVNTPVLPSEVLTISLQAPINTSNAFRFPFHVRIIYYQKDQRKTMRIINEGSFIKPKKAPVTKQTKVDPEVIKEEVKTVKLILQLPDSIRQNDIVFIRWINETKQTIYPEKEIHPLQFSIPLKKDEPLYGMFYCEKYHVLAKVKLDTRAILITGSETIKVSYLYDNRKDYYYGGYDMSYIKQPYKVDNGYYHIRWDFIKDQTARKQKRDAIKAYMQSLGYDSDFFYEPDLNKAINLERHIRNSNHEIIMEPVIWHHPLTSEGWDGGYEVFTNKFIIRFEEATKDDWVASLFKKYQITNYRKGTRQDYKTRRNYTYYSFEFKYIISRSYMRILDKMWMLKEVIQIEQIRSGLADMD